MRIARRLLFAIFLTVASNGIVHALSKPSTGAPDATSTSTTSPLIEVIANAVVDVRVTALEDARSLAELGRVRRGSGVVFDAEGHVLTSVYLVLEADDIEIVSRNGESTPARILAADFETGIAVLEPARRIAVNSLELGSAGTVGINAPAVVVSTDGHEQLVAVTYVVAKKPYQTGWEFAVDEAIFTQPAVPGWNGAGLVNERGRLIGIGSLLIHASGRVKPQGRKLDALGAMFIPVDQIRPVLDELLERGKRDEPERPWVGLLTQQARTGCEVTGVLPDSPASAAGIAPRDVIVSINARKVDSQRALYEALWDTGAAGVTLTVTVRRGEALRDFEVHSIGQSHYYRSDASD